MALTKEVSYDQIEVRGEYKAIHCRKATVIKEDGTEISRAFHRHVLHPSNLSFDPDDGSYIHITTDISGETQEVKDIAAIVWTDAVKAAWKSYQEDQNPVPDAS